MNRLSLASSVSKMSPELLAELLRLLADELSESQLKVSGKGFLKDSLNFEPPEENRCLYPDYDRCISSCNSARCRDSCKMRYCKQ